MVKKVKNAYKKTDGSPNAQARALLQLCDTPITADLPSPAEILHGHPAQVLCMGCHSHTRVNPAQCMIRKETQEPMWLQTIYKILFWHNKEASNAQM